MPNLGICGGADFVDVLHKGGIRLTYVYVIYFVEV